MSCISVKAWFTKYHFLLERKYFWLHKRLLMSNHREIIRSRLYNVLLIFYSIQWGKETSTEWVIAMVTSFLQSVLLLQPVKVVLLAVVFALCIRKPADLDDESGISLAKERSLLDQPKPVVVPCTQPRRKEKRKSYLR